MKKAERLCKRDGMLGYGSLGKAVRDVAVMLGMNITEKRHSTVYISEG